MSDTFQHPEYIVSFPQSQEHWDEDFGLEPTCGLGWEQESPWEASQESFGQDSWRYPPCVPRRNRCQSQGADSCPEYEPHRNSWQVLYRNSQHNMDSQKKIGPGRKIPYSPEEGVPWTSLRTARQLTNRSQQTNQVGPKKVVEHIMRGPEDKSESITGTQDKLVITVGEEISESTLSIFQEQKQKPKDQDFGLEPTCKPGWKQESPWEASQESAGQESGHYPPWVPRRDSCQSQGADSDWGCSCWQNFLHVLYWNSKVKEAQARTEQGQKMPYSPEEGVPWTSLRTARQLTNRSQQTNQVGPKKVVEHIMRGPEDKSESITGTQDKLVITVGEEISESTLSIFQEQKQKPKDQDFGLEPTCKPGWKQESPWEASQESAGQESGHYPPWVPRRDSCQSQGADSDWGCSCWQNFLHVLYWNSKVKEAQARTEQGQKMPYSPEEGVPWTSLRTARELTNRSQQTGQPGDKKAPEDVLKSPGGKSESSMDAEKSSVKRAEKEPPGSGPGPAGRAGPASRRGSQARGQESPGSSQQESEKESWHDTRSEWERGSQRSSQQELRVKSGGGSQLVSRQASQGGSRLSLTQSSRRSSQQLPGQQSRPGKEELGQAGKKSQVYRCPSDGSLQLVLQVECSKFQEIELVLEEQTAEPWGERDEGRAEECKVRLDQSPPAGMGGVERVYGCLSLEGGTCVGRTEKILINYDEETGNAVVRKIQEKGECPGWQQEQRAGGNAVPQVCDAADAERLQMMGQEPWQGAGAQKSGEVASDPPTATPSPGGSWNMAVSIEVVHKAQQTQSVVSLDEGLSMRRKTGKFLRSRSQQTSVSSLRKSSFPGCCGNGRAARGYKWGEQEPWAQPSDTDVPELQIHVSQGSGHCLLMAGREQLEKSQR